MDRNNGTAGCEADEREADEREAEECDGAKRD